jgi:hypothetical protein
MYGRFASTQRASAPIIRKPHFVINANTGRCEELVMKKLGDGDAYDHGAGAVGDIRAVRSCLRWPGLDRVW